MSDYPIIDLNGHVEHYFGEARRFRLQKFTDFPSTVGVPAGWLVDVNDTIQHWNGSQWINLGHIYTHPNFPLATNPFSVAKTSGLEILSQLSFNDSGHPTAVGSRMLTNADIVSIFLNDAIQSGTFTWSSNKIKDYVESYISQGLTGALVWQATNYIPAATQGAMTAPLPVSSATIKQGMTWVVSQPGFVGTDAVSAGDMIIAKIDNASNSPANYQVVNKNIEDIVAATELVKGILQLATNAEAIAGTNAEKAMTPKSTKAVLDAKVRSSTFNFGDGSSTSFTFTHNFGTMNLDAVVFRNTDNTKIHCATKTPTANTVKVDVYAPLSVNEYRITITARID